MLHQTDCFQYGTEELALTGTHNLFNSMQPVISANWPRHSQKNVSGEALGDFKGVEHRLEKVCRVKVDYINDSKATNVNSCWYALQKSMKPKQS